VNSAVSAPAMLRRPCRRVRIKRAAIPHQHAPADGQGPQGVPALQASSPGRTHRTRARPRSGDQEAVRHRGASAARGRTDRCPARRSLRPARASGAGPAAARLLDLRRPARPVPRHRPRLQDAHRRRGRGQRASRGHRAGRLVGAAHPSAAGGPGPRHLPGRRGHAVPRLAGGADRRPAGLRTGALCLGAGGRHPRVLPRRAPGAAARRGDQPRRTGQPPVRARLARPVRPRRPARPPPCAAPARLPVPARVPAGSPGERAVRPVLAPRRTPAPGTDRR
jgi:hypothetical protein